MLQVEQLCAGYDAREVLHGLSFSVRQGSIVVFIGANGAGKSTTLGAIMGIVKKFSGRILLDGVDITKQETDANVKKGLCLVPEGGRVFQEFTVQENLLLGAYTVREAKDVEERIEEVVSIFPKLKDRLQQKAGTLSGGERQMLAIGRALMIRPKLLLLDEPFLGLAPVMVDLVTESIQQINKERGVTLLVVEQNIRILSVSDEVHIMRLGEIVASEKDPQRLLQDDRISEAFIG